MQKFCKVSKIPGIIGAIDSTHVPIFSPGGATAEAFKSRKGFSFFNMQLICDSDLNILDCVARWPELAHDSTIFDYSRIRAHLQNNDFDGHLIEDKGSDRFVSL